MITFSTKLTLSLYLFSNLFRLKNSSFFIVWTALLIIQIISSYLSLDYSWLLINLFLFFLLIFGIPAIKWLVAKKYKANEIQFFFNTQEFGYSVVDLTTSVKINQIKSIQFFKNCIWIICNPSKLLFMGKPEDIVQIYQQLQSTDYAKFITQPQPNPDHH